MSLSSSSSVQMPLPLSRRYTVCHCLDATLCNALLPFTVGGGQYRLRSVLFVCDSDDENRRHVAVHVTDGSFRDPSAPLLAVFFDGVSFELAPDGARTFIDLLPMTLHNRSSYVCAALIYHRVNDNNNVTTGLSRPQRRRSRNNESNAPCSNNLDE